MSPGERWDHERESGGKGEQRLVNFCLAFFPPSPGCTAVPRDLAIHFLSPLRAIPILRPGREWDGGSILGRRQIFPGRSRVIYPLLLALAGGKRPDRATDDLGRALPRSMVSPGKVSRVTRLEIA